MFTRFSLFSAFAAACGLALLAPVVSAQDANTPYVVRPVQNLTVPAGTSTSKVNLKKTFGLNGVSQQVVRFATTYGNIDVELRPDVAPATVANFLTYVNSGAYTNSFFHRSVASFVIQGGGYTFTNNSVQTIPENAPVVNEFKLSNVRGTLAMAKLGGDPNSATDQWFFNESDSNASNLDNQNGGFTVFGDVIGTGMNVVDTIGALNYYVGTSPFDQLPVHDLASGADPTADNLVFVNSVTPIAMVPQHLGDPSLLTLSVKSSDYGLVTPMLSGKNLILTYIPGSTGTATITLKAKDAAKTKAKTSFTVTVQ